IGYVATLTDAGWANRFPRILRLAFVLAFVLYTGSLLLGGPGGRAILTPRPFALFAILAVAWGLAGWRLGSRDGLRLAGCAAALILLSLSRLAFAASLLLACLVWVDVRSAKHLVR